MTEAVMAEAETTPGPLWCPECGILTPTAEVRGVWSCDSCGHPRVTSGPPADLPRVVAGTIGIEWPAGFETAKARTIPAARTAFYDAEGYVTTVSRMELHADVFGCLWADLTMFADRDGNPVLHLADNMPNDEFARDYIVDGEPRTGTFPFLVTSMRCGKPPA